MSSKKYWLAASVALLALVALFSWSGRPRAARAGNRRVGSNVASRAEVPPVASTSVTAPAAAVPAPTGPTLFSYIGRPAEADAWEAKLRAPTKEIHYVHIDRELATGKASPFWKTGGGGQLDVALPDGGSISVVLNRTEQRGFEEFVSSGRIAGGGFGRAVFAYKDGEMSALIEDAEHGSWQLRAIANGVAQWFKVDASQVGPCGIGASDILDPQKLALLKRRAVAAGTVNENAVMANDAGPATPPVVAADAQSPELRILMVYTDTVGRANSPSAIASEMALAIKILNDDFALSKISATATLAGTMQVAYADDDIAGTGTDNQSTALTRLADPSDGYMDAIHAMRDQTAADLVCLTLARRDKNSAGIAFIEGEPGSPTNPSLGFSVVEYAVMNTQNIFPHEIGHNLGCAHDREHATDSKGNKSVGVYPYSYGYRFVGANGKEYHTIMSYDPGIRLPYFSNPDVTADAPISRPVGIPAGQPGEADNARTIRQDIFEVGNYRLSPQNPANPGTLVNVSTRAFVSTGAQQLIGGFIITGSQPKKVLVRAIGPTLAQYGVSDTLADPVMKLFRQADGTLLDQNDNWGTGPNAAAVAAAMTTAHAFALPAGSRDAAITATLPAGGYTANIEGLGGTSGTALVEAYELDQTGSRFLNLSTRAYADVNRPMIGGFIIQADPANPNATKRVMIRVLGPSLANFGVSGAMDDPIFELHDASGTLLLMNDDWSTGSTGGDDSKPYVRVYEEQQIAALGLAPGNRRDSGVLVDLRPGAYTAVVRPFEKLPEQPQKPGIGIVEVFEVNP